MVQIDNLRVSLTKNGFLKIWLLVKNHPSHKILDNCCGRHDGVNLQRSQVANIICAEPISGIAPSYWDDVREQSDQTIRAFTFLAIVFSHHRLIRAFIDAGQGLPTGFIAREDLANKEFTNLAYAMAEMGLCDYQRGAASIDYNLAPLIDRLRRTRGLVDRLLRSKLARCGWRDPDEFPESNDSPIALACREHQFHEALGMPFRDFREWLTGSPATSRR